jgi:rhodanese-related sulfurtransferase
MFTKPTYTRFVSLFIFSLLYSSTLFAELVNIDSIELKKLLSEKTLIIDVRRVEEWSDTGVIKNSKLLTFFDSQGNYNAEKWYANLSKLSNATTPVILICRSGVRSKAVANWMVNSLGYQKVYNVKDGMIGWKGSDGKTLAPE